jgi:hypothetical protein
MYARYAVARCIFPLGAISDRIDRSHEIHHRPRTQLPHGLPTMHLNGDLAHPELGGNLLVHLTRHHQDHDLTLALGEGIKSRAQVGGSGRGFPMFMVAFERDMYRVEKFLLANRLGQEFDCPCTHGPDSHRDIAVPRYEHNRYSDIQSLELSLEIEPTQPRQSNIKHQASLRIRGCILEEFGDRRKGNNIEPQRLQEVLESLSHVEIIVQDVNCIGYLHLRVHH